MEEEEFENDEVLEEPLCGVDEEAVQDQREARSSRSFLVTLECSNICKQWYVCMCVCLFMHCVHTCVCMDM